MNTINISKTTLDRIKTQAKSLAKSSNISLCAAKDKISKGKGFKSFNHCKSEQERFTHLPPIFLAIKRINTQDLFSLIKRYSNNKLHLVEDHAILRKFIDAINSKYSFYVDNKYNIADFVFFEFSSLKIDVKQERSEYKVNVRKHEFSVGGVTYNKYHESDFITGLSHTIYNKFQSSLIYKKEIEELYIEPDYILIDDLLLTTTGLLDEDYSDHVMNADFIHS